MLRTKDGPIWATTGAPLRGTSCVAAPNSSWEEKKSSNCFQAVPNGVAYLDPLEESTWSRNLDSAASMFPPSTLTLGGDLWRERFQDLSSYCCRPLQDTCPAMVGDTKGSSCTVQEDELNTPEIGVKREFNFTSTPNVSKQATSPYLSDGEGWGILSVEGDKSYVTAKKADDDNTQSKPANESFVDETWGLSVSHEEEIASSHNQGGLGLEVLVGDRETNNMQTSVHIQTPVNTCEVPIEHKAKCVDFLRCDLAAEANVRTFETETVHIGSLESLLGPSFGVTAPDSAMFPILTNQQQAGSNLSLKNLLSVSTCHGNTNVTSADDTCIADRATGSVRNTVVLAKAPGVCTTKAVESDGTLQENADNVTTADMLRTDIPIQMREQQQLSNCGLTDSAVPIVAVALPSESSEPRLRTDVNGEMTGGDGVLEPKAAAVEENVPKRSLKLNLAMCLGTDELVSTPVVLDSLFKQDEPFDLLSYVFDELEPDIVLPDSVDLDRIFTPCTAEVPTSTKADPVKVEVEPLTDVEVEADTEDDDDNEDDVMVVKPFVVETSPDRQWSDADAEAMDVEEECNQLSSNVEQLREPDQQFEGRTKSNLRKGLGVIGDERFRKARLQSRGDLQAHTSLESEVFQDGPGLKLKISRIKSDSSTKVPSSQKLPPRKSVSGLEELLLPKQTGGRPVKRAVPSTYKASGSSGGRTRRRKLSSSSTADESWTQSKKARTVSVDSHCDRYRHLRDRNNEASRKSRQNRKCRESEMTETAAILQRENQSLKIKAEEMERLVKKLRQALLEAVIKTKKAD